MCKFYVVYWTDVSILRVMNTKRVPYLKIADVSPAHVQKF